jgi:type I restriction enzyme S subunit
VGDIADVDIGFAFKSADYAKTGVRLLRGENIEPGALRWTDTRYWSETAAEALHHLLVQPGDLILAMDRPVVSAGLKLARARPVDCPCLLVQRVARLRGRMGTNSILHHALSSPAFVRHVLVGGLTGTQLPHISGKRIEDFEFPLAPHAEQRRIVEAIESYFTRLDDAVVTLERVERNLKRYRASVLKAAVEGRLVPTEAALAKQEGRKYEPASVLLERILVERRRRWTESGKKGKYQEPEAPDTKGLPDLPEGWCWASVDQIGDVSGGVTKNAKREKLSKALPYLRVANVYANELRLGEIKEIGLTEQEIERVLLRKNDLLVVEGNGSLDQLGRVALWDGSIDPCVHQNHLIKIRFDDSTLPEWALTWLLSPGGRLAIQQVASSTSGLHTLSISKIASVAIPLCPQPERTRIYDEVARAASMLEAAELGTVANRRRCTRLRQSILKWAFEGKLADQDPNDEPASVLLERIKAERSAAKPVKATRGQRGSKKQGRL